MGTCKQLLQLEGKTVMARCLENLFAGGIEDVIVVISSSQDEVARVAEKYPVLLVRNTDPDGDMATSVRTGLGALPSSATSVLIALCDYPLVTAETISRCIAEQRRWPDDIIIPCHNGRRGHPPLFPRRMLDDLAKPLTLRDLLLAYPKQIQHLEVQDPGVLIDMDTPEDYRRINEICANML